MRPHVIVLAALWAFTPLCSFLFFHLAGWSNPGKDEFFLQNMAVVAFYYFVNSIFLGMSLLLSRSLKTKHLVQCWSYSGIFSTVFIWVLLIPPSCFAVPMIGPFLPLVVTFMFFAASLVSTYVAFFRVSQ